jgi:uncharacterized protein
LNKSSKPDQDENSEKSQAQSLINYRTQVVDTLALDLQTEWQALQNRDAARQGHVPNPFLTHAWLRLLETSRSVGAGTGWSPAHLLTWMDTLDTSGKVVKSALAAILPLYAKQHSYGEYVFDWAWADAYARSGLEYYPKLLSAIPFTPVPGPRLMADTDEAARATLLALEKLAKANKISSIHMLFSRPFEQELLRERGWLERSNVQFHWQNKQWHDFEQYLSDLTQPKRKKIRAERRKFSELGLHCERLTSATITQDDWDFFYRCYCATYEAHHSTPYLTRDFFKGITQAVNCLLVKVMRGTEPIAASLCIYSESTLYGRYWGYIESLPFVHFEASYYQPIEFAIEQKIQTFEGGAQGEHKMARGFTPVHTHSMHWLAHPQFKDAIAKFLEREGQSIEGYLDELNERNPFIASTNTEPNA